VGTALGAHRYPQQEITSAFAGVVTADTVALALLRRFHSAAGVETRHLALPLDEYAGLDGFTAANDAFIRLGVDLGAGAVDRAL